MDILIFILAVTLAVYLSLLTMLAVMQRGLMYFPKGVIGTAASFGLAETQTRRIRTVDGQDIVAWYRAAKPGHPLFLFFHGNGGTLALHARFLGELAADGAGFLAIDYRGYGGSTGSPSEIGLIRDGDATYAEARSLGYAPDRIIAIGQSLGTAVAIAVAAKNPVRALILDSAFSSAADIAAERYTMFPVRLLMLDPWNSAARIGAVKAPILFVHATDDPVIPLAFCVELYAQAKPPKSLFEVPSIDHMVLEQSEVLALMKRWLAGLPPPHA